MKITNSIKFSLLSLAIVLVGCGSTPADVPADTPVDTDTPADQSEVSGSEITENGDLNLTVGKEIQDFREIDIVGEGEKCSSVQGLSCGDGLECMLDPNAPDGSGTCKAVFIDEDLVCDPMPAEVCGQIDRQKKTYMNECYAQKYGAEIIHSGSCKKQEENQWSCVAKAVGIGHCKELRTGYEFNAEQGACQQVSVQGCEAELPFFTLEECALECI